MPLLNRPAPLRAASRVSSALAAVLSPVLALAHDGHGQTGTHWHATDTAGFVLVAAVAAAGIWWSRRK